ncbi:transmembrane signal receptor [Lithospermum erythrorhizon]|uniref:Transmembrane signal receptor n=1 Tax=Lithospermum erythrorhizon TaxID=34254 RepID=A0AAV3R4Y0_LITER
MPKKENWRANKVLELVHSDICGPITPTSSSGNRYFLTFIDDYSRKGWVYLLANKSEALEQFKYFKAMVENETNANIKCLRTDRGGEYTSTDFTEYCKLMGIKRQLTTAYTPQQNGVAKRRNRTVMNMVRTMISGKKMPKVFWTEAIVWKFHLLNRCPTVSVDNMTPQQACSGLKPAVDHLRIWGCIAHVHIPKVQRGKLDERSIKCIFLGTSEGTKGYRLFDVQTKRIITSKDVVFEEDKHWDWGKEYEQQTGIEIEWEDKNAEIEEVQNDEEIEPGLTENDDADITIQDQHHTESHDSGEEEESESSKAMDQGRAISTSSRRVHRPLKWMEDYVSRNVMCDEDLINMVQEGDMEDPLTFEEAIIHEHWRKAMKAEMTAIEKNNTWFLTELPQHAKKVGVKWIFKTKRDEAGKITKHKARLVAKGYSQKAGVDYSEVFAPVARMDTIRMMINIAAQKKWKIHQLDVKSAFLQGEISENVYVDQPQGYEIKGKEHKVYKLQKALYGLKQAPRAWFSNLETHFTQEGFSRCDSEQTLFTKRNNVNSIIMVSVYVDDLIYTGNDDEMMKQFKEFMLRDFEMSDLGLMTYYLGIEVLQTNKGNFICQRRYAEEILKRFGMSECNPVVCPIVPGEKIDRDERGNLVEEVYFKKIVGSLMYLTHTRPDLTFSVSLLSRFMCKPTEIHLQIAKRILRYIKRTVNLGIMYKWKEDEDDMVVYTDSDYAGDKQDRKSTSGYVFLLNTGAVAWSSKKQPIVTLSTTEAEFIAAAMCTCQTIWMKRILSELGHEIGDCIQLKCDNSSTINLSKNPVMHGRYKHIDVRFHFLRELTKQGKIALEFCGSTDQVADIMTKPLKANAFIKLRAELGMCEISEVN